MSPETRTRMICGQVIAVCEEILAGTITPEDAPRRTLAIVGGGIADELEAAHRWQTSTGTALWERAQDFRAVATLEDTSDDDQDA